MLRSSLHLFQTTLKKQIYYPVPDRNIKGTLVHIKTKMFLLCLGNRNACLRKSTLFQSQNSQRKRAIFILSSSVREVKRACKP